MLNEYQLEYLLERYLDCVNMADPSAALIKRNLREFAQDVEILMKNSGANVQNIHHLR